MFIVTAICECPRISITTRAGTPAANRSVAHPCRASCRRMRRSPASSVLLISKPHEERRAYATAWKAWPGVEIISASTPMTLNEYVDSIQDARLVIDMLVGALQRLLIYPEQGFMIELPVPDEVLEAYERLCREGFTSRLLTTDNPST